MARTAPKRRRAAPKSPPTDPGMTGTEVQLARDRELIEQGYWFDVEEADRVCLFFERFLRHSKGEWSGEYFTLQDWQRATVRRFYGWKRPGGTRRYRKLYVEIGRKNGKSTFAAGMALELTFADHEPGANVYGAAADKAQAKIVFREAANMVSASPDLAEMSQTYKSAIVVPETLSSYEPISSEASNKDGLNPHGVIVDELHEWGPGHRELWEKLTTAQGARRQPVTAIFTTAGDDPHSLWAEERDYALRVASGEVIDDEYLPVIFRAMPEDDWHDPETWKKANPGYGITVKPEYLESQHRLALEKPRFVAAFKRYHLNVMSNEAGGGLPMDAWDVCASVGAADPEDLRGRKCWAAMDLSRRIDMTALVGVFPDEDGVCDVLARLYIPESMIEIKERTDKVPMRLWVEQGLVVATPGNVIDYAYIRADVLRWARQFELQQLAYDKYGSTQLALQLIDDGINCFEHEQNYLAMSEPSKLLEERLLQGRIRVGKNPVLRWQASNVVFSVDPNENIKPNKRRSTARIDGIVALIMALGCATLGEDGGSVYDSGGIRTT